MLNGGNEHKSTLTLLLLPSSVHIETCTHTHFTRPKRAELKRMRARHADAWAHGPSVRDPEIFRTYYINACPQYQYSTYITNIRCCRLRVFLISDTKVSTHMPCNWGGSCAVVVFVTVSLSKIQQHAPLQPTLTNVKRSKNQNENRNVMCSSHSAAISFERAVDSNGVNSKTSIETFFMLKSHKFSMKCENRQEHFHHEANDEMFGLKNRRVRAEHAQSPLRTNGNLFTLFSKFEHFACTLSYLLAKYFYPHC